MKTLYWPSTFGPSYTPKEMLELGIFEGKYINAIKGSPKLPDDWFDLPKVLGKDDEPDPSINFYGVKSRQSLSEWQKKGWTTGLSPFGWFEWYCKFYLGRRDTKEDILQINRWRSFVARHNAQVQQKCRLTDRSCNTRQRQGLLQWGWNSEKDSFDDKTIQSSAKRLAELTDSHLLTISKTNSIDW